MQSYLWSHCCCWRGVQRRVRQYRARSATLQWQRQPDICTTFVYIAASADALTQILETRMQQMLVSRMSTSVGRRCWRCVVTSSAAPVRPSAFSPRFPLLFHPLNLLLPLSSAVWPQHSVACLSLQGHCPLCASSSSPPPSFLTDRRDHTTLRMLHSCSSKGVYSAL
jgi:hypothetical protein